MTDALAFYALGCISTMMVIGVLSGVRIILNVKGQ